MNATLPIHFELGGLSIYLVDIPQDGKISHYLDAFSNHDMRARFIKNVFGVPSRATDVIKAESSGSARTPLSTGRVMPSNQRIFHMQQLSTLDGLQERQTNKAFVSHIADFMDGLVVASGIGDEWVFRTDLYTFTRDCASTAVFNGLCGPRILKQCPAFLESFWVFDANVHWLHIGVPRICCEMHIRRGTVAWTPLWSGSDAPLPSRRRRCTETWACGTMYGA